MNNKLKLDPFKLIIQKEAVKNNLAASKIINIFISSSLPQLSL